AGAAMWMARDTTIHATPRPARRARSRPEPAAGFTPDAVAARAAPDPAGAPPAGSALPRRHASPDHDLLVVPAHHRVAGLAAERAGEGRQVGRRADGAEV